MHSGVLHRAALCLILISTAGAAELFNGRDLSGWSTFLADTKAEDPRGVFSATNGLLRISGEGLGYLKSKSAYSNYRLALEYRWGRTNFAWGGRIGKARDSGVFLHATGPDGNSFDGGGAFMAAIECNVFQGATGDFLLIRGKDEHGQPIHPRATVTVASARDADGWPTWSPKGEATAIERWGRINWRDKDPNWKDIIDFRGGRDLEKPAPELNLLECLCDGDTIEIRLNGVTINRATEVWPKDGHILLQCEGSEIYFKRVSLEPLMRGAADAPLK